MNKEPKTPVWMLLFIGIPNGVNGVRRSGGVRREQRKADTNWKNPE